MFDLKLPTRRRGFLGTVAAGAATLGLGAVAGPAELAAESLRSGDNPAFEAWLNKITGKHKQMFDATAVNDGFGLIWARVFLNTANDTYGTTDADNSAVVVLRHFAAPLALGDAAWAKYKLGEFIKLNDPRTNAPAVRNPHAHLTAAEEMIPGIGVEELLAKGVMMCVCNVALTVFGGMLAKGAGMTPDAVHQDLVANVIPGIQLAPSGILAVNRTQAKGCGYAFAG